VESTKHLH